MKQDHVEDLARIRNLSLFKSALQTITAKITLERLEQALEDRPTSYRKAVQQRLNELG